jgi:hypothetical protein
MEFCQQNSMPQGLYRSKFTSIIWLSVKGLQKAIMVYEYENGVWFTL